MAVVAHNSLRLATRHSSMRPLAARSLATTSSHQVPVALDPAEFDARVSAWERNEAREASIMSSASSRSSANALDHHRTSNPPGGVHHPLDPRFPFVEVGMLPRGASSLPRHSRRVAPAPSANRSGWVAPSAPGPSLVTAAAAAAPPVGVASQQSHATPALSPLLSPLSVAQGNNTTRLHYDLRTLPVNVRLSARDPTTPGAPERYLPRSDVRHLMHKRAFHPLLGSVCIVSSLFPWVIQVDVGHSGLILIDDVLAAVHNALHQQISHREWDQLTATQQDRVAAAWENALALSNTGVPTSSLPATANAPAQGTSWYTRLFSSSATTATATAAANTPSSRCCKPKYRRHANEAGILPPLSASAGPAATPNGSVSSAEEGNEKNIVLRKRERTEGVLRIDWVCGKTRWGGLVHDDEVARRRGVPRERWAQTWCLVLE